MACPYFWCMPFFVVCPFLIEMPALKWVSIPYRYSDKPSEYILQANILDGSQVNAKKNACPLRRR
jgi:hypothetical protein